MKSTGIVRPLDRLGRVVLPIELRRTLGIGEKEPLEILVDGEMIVLRKHGPACAVCGSAEGVAKIKNQQICKNCITAIKNDV